MQGKATDKEREDGSAVATESRLRLARVEAGINVDEVADRLHLDRDVILAIEAGDFEGLGAPVFVKGHLRSYARLLGLPEDEISASHKVSEPEPEEFRTLSAPITVKSGANLSNFVLWVMLSLIALVGVIYMLVGDDDVANSDFVTSAPDAEVLVRSAGVTELGVKVPVQVESVSDTDADTPAPVQADSGPAVGGESAAADLPEADAASDPGAQRSRAANPVTGDTVPATPEPDDALAPVSATEPEPSPQPSPEPVTLSLAFANECWVEVSDSKRRLLYGLEKAGTQRVLEGMPPFRLFLGNTDAVTVRVAGKEYRVPRSVRTGSNTARFSIDKDVIAGMRD
jgi:cytoskeleton protein RodZ